ncbi:DUF5047 domain-containing protein [Micromonosporaceae bacterium B7E4]
MRPVSDAFLRTLRGSHRMVAELRAVAPGQTGVDPAGTVLTLLGGTVSQDATAVSRSRIVATVDGTGMWPTRADDLLAPYGQELFARRGIRYGNGVTEWVSLGYFRIDSPEQDQPADGPITISGRDRMSGIEDGKLTAPIQFPATATLGAVVDQLVTDVYPAAVIDWDDTTDTEQIGRTVIAEEDRYGFLDELIRAVGKTWYWDHRGHLVVRTPPDPTDPVWTVDHGEGGVLVSLARSLSREGVYNGIVAIGEGADTTVPARAVVVDNNPTSPTRWGGPFGKVPRRFSSPFITSNAQASIAAAAELRRTLGLPYNVNFEAVPNPALEADDPIRVRYPGRSEAHVLERLSIPLTAEDAMAGTTREQTTIILGSV